MSDRSNNPLLTGCAGSIGCLFAIYSMFNHINPAATPRQFGEGSNFISRIVKKLSKTPDQQTCLDFFLRPDG